MLLQKIVSSNLKWTNEQSALKSWPQMIYKLYYDNGVFGNVYHLALYNTKR